MKLRALLEAKQQLPEIEAFMKDFDEETYQHPFARHLRIWQDSIGFEVKPWNGTIDLGAIMSFKSKGEGEASKALKWLTDLADKHGVKIELAVQPIKNAGAEGKSLTKSQLTAWYKRNGFKSSGGEYMLREPKKLTEANDDFQKLYSALQKILPKKFKVTVRDEFSNTKQVNPKIYVKLNKSQSKDLPFIVGLETFIDDTLELFPGFKHVRFPDSGLQIIEIARARMDENLVEGIELQYDRLDGTEVGDDRNGKQLEKLGQALAKKLDDRYEVFLFSETFKSSAKNFILYVKPKKKGSNFAVGERGLKELMQMIEDMVDVFDGKYLVHFYKSSREIAVELKR